jgi:predicted NAD/FAD-binding protein
VQTRIAVIGAGAAGLSAAYHLRADAAVTLFESAGRAGGHANTVEVDDPRGPVGLDTAFVVFNPPHYPRLTAFFEELGVESLPHRGGFTLFDLDAGFTIGTEEAELSPDELRARCTPDVADMLLEADRFYREAPRDCVRRRADMPLGEYLEKNGYSERFRYDFVVLIATAVWSVPPELIWEMPAATLITFYVAHGRGGIGGRTVQWRTVRGGSIRYVRAAQAAITAAGGRIHTGTPVTGVREEGDRVVVATGRGAEQFDYAVIATHADDALTLLERPDAGQRQLARIRYSDATVVLHTDPSVQPADRARWQSWNYGRKQVGGQTRTWVNYYLNHLQELDAERDYFVSLDCPLPIAAEHVIAEIRYRHPVLTMPVRRMQDSLHALNTGRRVKLCGSYFYSRSLGPDIIATHESAYDSGLAAAQACKNDIARTLVGAVPAGAAPSEETR